jgi:hypothetical protein
VYEFVASKSRDYTYFSDYIKTKEHDEIKLSAQLCSSYAAEAYVICVAEKDVKRRYSQPCDV